MNFDYDDGDDVYDVRELHGDLLFDLEIFLLVNHWIFLQILIELLLNGHRDGDYVGLHDHDDHDGYADHDYDDGFLMGNHASEQILHDDGDHAK